MQPEIKKRQVIELPYATSIEDKDLFYLRAGNFDYQLQFETLKNQIANDSTYLKKDNALSEISSIASVARSNLGLGSAATYDAGVIAGNVLIVGEKNGLPSLPPIDGSQLLNVGGSAGGVNSNTAGDGLSINSALSLSVNCDNATLEVVNDKVQVKDSGINFSKIANGSILGRHISNAAVDGTSISIVNGQLKATGPTIQTGEIGDFTMPAKKLYVMPPIGKTMGDFQGGIVSPAEIDLAQMNFINGFDEDSRLITRYTIDASRVVITAFMGPTYITDGSNDRNIKVNYIFFWS